MEGNDFVSTVPPELEHALFGMALSELQTRLEYDPRLLRAWNLIQEQYANPVLDLPTAAGAAILGKNTLNGYLKPCIGRTFGDLLTRYRLYRSILIVLTRESTFTEAALASGFDSRSDDVDSNVSSRYSRTFKKVLGLPPSRFLPRGPDRRRRVDPGALRRALPSRPVERPRSKAAGVSRGGGRIPPIASGRTRRNRLNTGDSLCRAGRDSPAWHT